jgi:hypothetical protein
MKKDFRRKSLLFSILIYSCFVAAQLKADDTHYKNMLVGERAATMGGTYVAISDDSTGCYYNPAGIAYAVGDSLSGSGNVLHLCLTTLAYSKNTNLTRFAFHMWSRKHLLNTRIWFSIIR